jgi:hypothetical protein
MTRGNDKSTLRTYLRLRVLRGAFGGSRLWMYVGVTAWALRLFGRLAARKPVIHTEKLNPGERMLITHLKRDQA